jgi:hypothetical protein
MPVRTESILRSDHSTITNGNQAFHSEELCDRQQQSKQSQRTRWFFFCPCGDRVQVPVQKTPSEAGTALGLDTPSSGLRRRQYVDDYRHSVHSNPLLLPDNSPKQGYMSPTTHRFFCSSAACFLYTLHTTTFSTSVVGFGKVHPFVR